MRELITPSKPARDPDSLPQQTAPVYRELFASTPAITGDLGVTPQAPPDISVGLTFKITF